MKNPPTKISGVAPPKKNRPVRRSLRLTEKLSDDVALLAELQHRTGNDEIVVAIEERVARHRKAIEDYRERRGPEPPRKKW